MNKGKNFFSFIISLLLLFSIIFTGLIVFFKTKLINEDFYCKVLLDNKVIDDMYEEINLNTKYIFVKNNVPKKYLDKVITKKELESEIRKNLKSILDYLKCENDKVEEIDVTKYTNRVNDAIDNYCKDVGVQDSEVSENVFEEIRTEAKENLKSEISIINFSSLTGMNFINVLRTTIHLLNNKIILFSIITMDFVFALILLIIWRKRIYSGVNWIGYSIFSAGILYTLIFFSGYLSKFYYYVSITPEYIQNMIIYITKNYLISLTLFGVTLLIIGLMFMINNWIHIYGDKKVD